jgi:predicted Zn finger-like uncharacterized protein
MKFLCPSCKAKYQIADDKVAGRSVRMKCRKCGFVIPISEIPPAPETLPPDEAGWDAPPPVVPKAPAAPNVGNPPPSTPAATAAPSRVAPIPKPAPKPPSAPGASPAPLSAAKPAGTKPAAPAARAPLPSAIATTRGPVPKLGLASSALGKATSSAVAAVAIAPAPSSAPVIVAAPSGVELLPAVDEGNDEDDDATRIVRGGALADAFGALVGGAAGSAPSEIGMPADEWFVGINDVPVGPIRLGEIRKRALLGAVTLDSMVWRDGLEAWRPLKTFPELVAVLEESMSSVRASAAPLVRPAAGVPPPGKSADPDSFAGASSGITGTAVVTDDLATAGLGRARSPIFAWLAVLVALGFGVTIGFVVWSKQKPPETIVKYVEVPAKGQAAPVVAVVQDPQAAAAGPAASGTAPKTHGSKGANTHGSDATADKGGGLSGLKGLSALGPSGGPGVTGASPGTAPVGGGGQLDGAQTQATVARYTGSVKRSCWQPALDARDPNAPTSARVTLTISVGATGSVQNVTTSGDPRGYPGLANCIAARVHAWQFPATGGSTTVNVPFVFAAQ